jgi:transcriptional regulator with XRE-family HTH domain
MGMRNKTTPTKEPIHDFRVEAGKTLEEISVLFPVSTRTLIRWEQGEPRIPVKWMAKARTVYGKDPAEIRPDIFEAAQ